MSGLRLVVDNEGRQQLRALPPAAGEPEPPQADDPSNDAPVLVGEERILAPGAPPSPGTVPLDLARLLRRNEAVVWWNRKPRIRWSLISALAGVGGLLLLSITLFAPEIWARGFLAMLKPIGAVFSPAIVLFFRELLSLRRTLVTDNSVIDLPRFGAADRIGFRNVDRVRRDLLTGGIVLHGKEHKVRIPPELTDDARMAIASQTKHTIKAGPDQPDDPHGWLP